MSVITRFGPTILFSCFGYKANCSCSVKIWIQKKRSVWDFFFVTVLRCELLRGWGLTTGRKKHVSSDQVRCPIIGPGLQLKVVGNLERY